MLFFVLFVFKTLCRPQCIELVSLFPINSIENMNYFDIKWIRFCMGRNVTKK